MVSIIIKYRENERTGNRQTHNWRFDASGGVTPNKNRTKNAIAYFAENVCVPPPASSRWDVVRQLERMLSKKKYKLKINQTKNVNLQ